MNKATTLEELYEIAHTLDEENPATIESYHRIADRIRTETIGNNKRARPNTLAQAAPTGHLNATGSTSTSFTTSSTPAASVGDFFARARASAFFLRTQFFLRTRMRAHGFETQNKKCAGAAWNANYFCALARCERIGHAIRF